MGEAWQPVAIIIEDNPLIAELIAETCAGESYSWRSYGDGRQALYEMPHLRFDVVIIDLHIPGFVGSALLDRLADPPYSLHDTPICALTGDPVGALLDLVRKELNVRFFLKPDGIYQIADYLRQIRPGHKRPEGDPRTPESCSGR